MASGAVPPACFVRAEGRLPPRGGAHSGRTFPRADLVCLARQPRLLKAVARQQRRPLRRGSEAKRSHRFRAGLAFRPLAADIRPRAPGVSGTQSNIRFTKKPSPPLVADRRSRLSSVTPSPRWLALRVPCSRPVSFSRRHGRPRNCCGLRQLATNAAQPSKKQKPFRCAKRALLF
jgi:hypothetical protein